MFKQVEIYDPIETLKILKKRLIENTPSTLIELEHEGDTVFIDHRSALKWMELCIGMQSSLDDPLVDALLYIQETMKKIPTIQVDGGFYIGHWTMEDLFNDVIDKMEKSP